MNRSNFLLVCSLMFAAGNVLAAPPTPSNAPPATSPSTAHADMDMAGMKMDGMKMDTSKDKAAFDKLDANHDGNLTKSELPNNDPLLARFGTLDMNRDGSLSPAEFAMQHEM